MIHLLPSTASQPYFVSPFQARKFLPSFTHYLMVIVNQATSEDVALILNPSVDNERYTKCFISTNIDIPLSGNVPLTESGLYTYTIYGQNSETNLRPDSTDVVGTCATGSLRVAASEAWQLENINIPDNVIYYE